MNVFETPREREVLDLALAAVRELQVLPRVVADVISRARDILARAEDVVIAGDVEQDAVSDDTRNLLKQAMATIANIELAAANAPVGRPRSSLN